MQQMLEQIGYLRSESLVYTSLLELGNVSAGKIAKKAKLNRVSVYKALNKLISDGLVSYTIKANTKTFNSSSPEKIKEILSKKKSELLEAEEKIPSLMELFNQKKKKVDIEIYEGISGAKTIWEEMLKSSKKNNEWLVLGAPNSAENLGGYLEELNKRRAKKQVKLKIIYNADAKELISSRKKQSLTQVKTMPKEYITPASLEILNETTLLVIYEPQLIVFALKSKEVANSFKQYFNMLWNK